MIPLRYKDVKFEDVPAEIKVHFESMVQSRRGIYIYGPVGTGKTHILWALRKKRAEIAEDKKTENVMRSWFYNTTELLHKIRSDFNNKTEDTLTDLLEYDGILFLDDIGAEKITDWVQETFYMIINKRYEQMLPTIFTSNLPIADLAERIGDRTASRIVEMCEIIKLDGKDRRLETQEHLIGKEESKLKN